MTTDARSRVLAATHLEAAQAGDGRAFDQLVGPYRRELLAHCYRMLGSIHDADDALQDTLLRAWQGIGGFAGRSSLRTWLFRIATNAAIALGQRKGRTQAPMDPHWLEPYPYHDDETAPAAAIDRLESLEIAFVAAVQHLPPKERAVLLLREVLGFSALETAELLDVTVAAVTSRLQRARVRVRSRLPEQSQHDILRRLDDRRLSALVTAYVDAWEAGDADAIVALITDDATFSMPPQALTVHGREAIGAFLRDTPMRYPWRLVPTRASGQLAFGCYTLEGSIWVAHSVDVLTLHGDRIACITAFNEPSLLPILGLPPHLDNL